MNQVRYYASDLFIPPLVGSGMVVKVPGVGVFTGRDNELAVYNGVGYDFSIIQPGVATLLENASEHAILYWDGTVMNRYDLTISGSSTLTIVRAGSAYWNQAGQTMSVPAGINLLTTGSFTNDGILINDGRIVGVL